MNFIELLRHVGIFGGAVIVSLALLSVFSVAMIIDKHRRFSSTTRESEKFKPEFKKFLHGGDVQNLVEAGRLHPNSHVAQVVSGGIAEALVSTAMGIFVAIPAVVAFNHFTGKIETFHVEMNRASSQLVNRLFKIPELKGLDVEMADVKAPTVKKEGPAYATR